MASQCVHETGPQRSRCIKEKPNIPTTQRSGVCGRRSTRCLLPENERLEWLSGVRSKRSLLLAKKSYTDTLMPSRALLDKARHVALGVYVENLKEAHAFNSMLEEVGTKASLSSAATQLLRFDEFLLQQGSFVVHHANPEDVAGAIEEVYASHPCKVQLRELFAKVYGFSSEAALAQKLLPRELQYNNYGHL